MMGVAHDSYGDGDGDEDGKDGDTAYSGIQIRWTRRAKCIETALFRSCHSVDICTGSGMCQHEITRTPIESCGDGRVEMATGMAMGMAMLKIRTTADATYRLYRRFD